MSLILPGKFVRDTSGGEAGSKEKTETQEVTKVALGLCIASNRARWLKGHYIILREGKKKSLLSQKFLANLVKLNVFKTPTFKEKWRGGKSSLF